METRIPKSPKNRWRDFLTHVHHFSIFSCHMTTFIGPVILLTIALLTLPYWLVGQVNYIIHRHDEGGWDKWQILFIGTYVIMLVAGALGFVAVFVKQRMLYMAGTAVAVVSLIAQVGYDVKMSLVYHHNLYMQWSVWACKYIMYACSTVDFLQGKYCQTWCHN
jgi:hypothetical protein